MTQNAKLLNFLETHPAGISQLEAFNTLGICRLSERVRELEALGYVLSHTPEKTQGGARVIRYRFVGTWRNTPLGREYIGRAPGMIFSSAINDPASWDATPMVDV